MDAFTIMAFTFATTGFIFAIIGFTLATQANAKLATIEERLNELEAEAKE
ncbi:hypothetical protein LG275_08100 [Chryseomicrobium palamuruense]